MTALPRSLLAVAAILAHVPATAAGQSVADVVNGMYSAMERYSEDVDNYTVVQTVMGFETRTYFEKEVVDGRTIFRPREMAAADRGMRGGGNDLRFGDITEFGDGLVEHGRYAGRETVDGREVHVIAVDDLSALDMPTPAGPRDVEFEPRSGRIYVDTELFVPRRMEFVGEAASPGGPQEVTTRVDMLEYREVDGLLVSYRNVITIDGLQAMVDPEMEAQLEEMMKQLETMDPEQRAMMERMMGPQIEQLREMMSGGGGAMTMEITVTEVIVNSGPPGR